MTHHICNVCAPCKVHNMSCLVVHLDGKCDYKDGPCTCKLTPQPLDMSGEEKKENLGKFWWTVAPYYKQYRPDEDGGVHDIPAIIAEARKLAIEECIETLGKMTHRHTDCKTTYIDACEVGFDKARRDIIHRLKSLEEGKK